MPRGAGVLAVLRRAPLGVHLGAVARRRSLARPGCIPSAAAAGPTARSENAPCPAWGHSARMSTPHAARLAGPEASCARRLGSRCPRAQRCPPAKQRERAISEGRLGLASRRPGSPRWVTWTVPSGTWAQGGAKPQRRKRLQPLVREQYAQAAGRHPPSLSTSDLPRPAPFALNDASAFLYVNNYQPGSSDSEAVSFI